MKKIFTLLLVVFVLTTTAQDYQLFTVNSKKVYKTLEPLAKTYSLVFDSSAVISSGTVLYPYRHINNEMTTPENCQPWGGGCYAKNSPIWIGGSILQKLDGDYQFNNTSGDSLLFDFSLAPLQSHIFYEDETQRFSISVAMPPLDTFHLGGFIDTIKLFQITHTDLEGNIINSSLNNFNIKIGKELGLINFFRIDSFPQVLTPLELLGNESPDAGFYQLTNAMVFDHQPGDEIQYFEYYHFAFQPEFNYNRYTKHTFLEREETADSLIYQIQISSFEVDSTVVTIDTIMMKYLKDEIIATIPFDFPSNEYFIKTELVMQNQTGALHWTYNTDNYHNRIYCADDDLWCDSDIDGFEKKSYVVGLGIYDESWESVHLYPQIGRTAFYYKKDGISHGTEVFVGLKEIHKENLIRIIPNPATELVQISGDFTNGSSLCIKDLHGRHVMMIEDYHKNQPLPINYLMPGVYLLLIMDSNSVYSAKLVIQ